MGVSTVSGAVVLVRGDVLVAGGVDGVGGSQLPYVYLDGSGDG